MTAQPPRQTDPQAHSQTPPQTDIVLERLTALHPKLIDLGLDRTERLLGALGHPERNLPPVIHVAGTNGKGSTIAFMRAIAEAAGLSVHTYTSPHLIRFHERIVLNGTPIAEDIGRVEPPAEPGFQQQQIRRVTGKSQKCRRGRYFEKGDRRAVIRGFALF